MKGFSMVELLVAIAIIGLLVAMLLPAVQRTRATSHKLSCENLLKQVALASHAYEESHLVFPVSMQPCRRLLPYVGQSALYTLLEQDPFPDVEFGVTQYLCPSDPQASTALGHMSYFVNHGSGFLRVEQGQRLFDGASLGVGMWSRTRDFTDGTSNTAFFAERKIIADYLSVTDQIAEADPNRYMWLLARDFQMPSQSEFEGFRDECLSSRATAVPQHVLPFNFKLQLDQGYNHGLTPNRPGCHNTTILGTRRLDAAESLVSSTSHHSGGVNVAFADGHVRFIADPIDADVWTAISTRNGNETIGEF